MTGKKNIVDPNPETFRRTPEEERERFRRLDEQVEAMKAAGVSPDLPIELRRSTTTVSTAQLVDALGLDALRARGDAWQGERRTLVCWRALFPPSRYPTGAPPGFLELRLTPRQLRAGRAACLAAGAYEACQYKREGPTCLCERAVDELGRARLNLSVSLGHEATAESRLVQRQFALDAPVPLRPTDPLVVTQRWLLGGERVSVENAAQVDPLSGRLVSSDVVTVTGGERLLILGGNPGRGKTIAAMYALAREAGSYLLDAALSRPSDVDGLVGARGVVVVDQLRLVDVDPQHRATDRIEEVVLRRFAAGRRTMLVGNIDHLAFARRFGDVRNLNGEPNIVHAGLIAERCSQSGLFVLFGGASMRERADDGV